MPLCGVQRASRRFWNKTGVRKWKTRFTDYSLNLRGDYRVRILDWIHEHHPELDELYHAIYSKGDRTYWSELDQKMREYTAGAGMPYLRDDDQHRAAFGQPPVVVNYFFHEEVKKSAKKKL